MTISHLVSWPLWDEAINGYYALQLDQHWSWRPFFFFSQLPPFYIWLLSLVYKITGSLLTSLRFEPALIWALSLPAAYWAARAFVPRSSALLFVALSGSDFWALFFSNISHQAVLLILWEYLLIGFLGRLGKTPDNKRGSLCFGLGLILGTGFYTYFAWPLVALWAGVVILWILRDQKAQKKKALFMLGLPLAIMVLPMVLAFFHGDYGSYFAFLWSWKGGNDWAGQTQDLFWTLCSFFWGNPLREFTYGPVWGGFFNPLTGAAALLGIFSFYQSRKEGINLAFFGGLSLFLVPALFTHHVTLVREIAVLPLLSFAVLRGLELLLDGFNIQKTIKGLGLFLVLSTALDLHHLTREKEFIGKLLEAQKTFENSQAFLALDELQKTKGPGWVLTSFSHDLFTYDRSLSVACYPFNLAQNPHLDPVSGRWTAVVANAHLKPFLEKRFPQASFQFLSDAAHAERDDYNGGLMLMVIQDPPSKEVQNWIEWDRKVREISDQTMELPVAQARSRTLEGLQEAPPSQDPFLRSCYWEMIYTGYSWIDRYGGGNIQENFPKTLSALQMGLSQGYPTAYFYNELGTCYALMGDKEKATVSFEKAIHAPLDLTPAKENLKALEEMKKDGKL
jgi:hypothetical protein